MGHSSMSATINKVTWFLQMATCSYVLRQVPRLPQITKMYSQKSLGTRYEVAIGLLNQETKY